MPLRIVNVLADWYDKLFVTVKWDDHFFLIGFLFIVVHVYSFLTNHVLSA